MFELSPKGRGSWIEQVLLSFDGNNGCDPVANLTLDSKGNLYGTTFVGGADGLGTVFELSPPAESGGAWTETVLHSFPSSGTDGYLMYGNVIFDSKGNLYGTTFVGGADGLGTVFELSPPAESGGAWTEADLWDFNWGDGALPEAGLVFDTHGNLYGTTYVGGPSIPPLGVVFELSPSGDGSWAETVIHSFPSSADDGFEPLNGSLIMDGDGNLYGTTHAGGAYNPLQQGWGTVFELSPEAGGSWTETVLHSFNATATDGTVPQGGLFRDSDGNLYGTVPDNGADYVGGVFELSQSNGVWTEKLVHSFNSKGADGEMATGGVIFDRRGNLYGTTSLSGSKGFGTVYELSPEKGENGEKSGSWTEKTLFNFDNIDGAFSVGGLIFDSGGNLYGTTEYGACDGDGSVFELSPDEDGGWTEELLTDFGPGRRPSNPGFESLIRDAQGNLYGTTINGGKYGWGTVFEVSPNGRGGWTKKVLHDFENSSDGANPNAGVTFDAYGNLYGTTFVGGADGLGTVFELSPPAESGGAWTETVLHSFPSSGTDGYLMYGNVIFDSEGNLYGTTNNGGANGAGAVLEFSPPAESGGAWTETVLYSFTGYPSGDAFNPTSGVTFDAHGNLYGTSQPGGTNFAGAVFELSPPAESGGAWTEKVLYSFGSSPTDGTLPYAGVILDREGNLYGTTQHGGADNAGTVYEIIP